MTSTDWHITRLRIMGWLYRHRIVRLFLVEMVLVPRVADSIRRTVVGIVSRMKIGMSLEEATPRAANTERRRIEGVIRQNEDEACLSRRRLEKIRREVDDHKRPVG